MEMSMRKKEKACFKPGNKTALIRHFLKNDGHEPILHDEEVKILVAKHNKFKRRLTESGYVWLYNVHTVYPANFESEMSNLFDFLIETWCSVLQFYSPNEQTGVVCVISKTIKWIKRDPTKNR